MSGATATSFRNALRPWAMLAPLLVGIALVYLYPLGRTVSLSLTGNAIRNWWLAATDLLLWLSIANTLVFSLGLVVLQLPLSLGLALLLNGLRGPGRRIWRAAFFSTHLVGVAFAGVLVHALVSGRDSVLNAALLWTGIIDQPWRPLESPATVMPLLIVVSVWLGAGFGMVYLLAALQKVDTHLLDAAHLDGAGRWQRFWNVTLAQLRPTLSFLAVAGLLWGMQLFELPYVIFGGPGPGYRGLTISMYVFAQSFREGQFEYASAVALISAGFIAGLTLIAARLLRVGREEVQLD